MAIPPQDLDSLISRTASLNWLDQPPILFPSIIPPEIIPPRFLAGRVHSLRSISKVIVRETLQASWQFLKSLSMETLNESTYVFTFEDDHDLQRIQDLSPWNIRGHPLILKPWDRSMSLNELDFSEAPYWIQVHDLPLELINSQNAEIIGNQLGTFLCTEEAGSGSSQRKNFLRLKVLLPLRNPLITGFNQPRLNRHPSWVQLKYERLSDFCFNCGLLGHIQLYCPATGYIPSPSLFGPILRAVPPAPFKLDNILSTKKLASPLNHPSLNNPSIPHTKSSTIPLPSSTFASSSHSIPCPMDISGCLPSFASQNIPTHNIPTQNIHVPLSSFSNPITPCLNIPQSINPLSQCPPPSLSPALTPSPEPRVGIQSPPLHLIPVLPPLFSSPTSPGPHSGHLSFSPSNSIPKFPVFRSLITDIEDITDISSCPHLNPLTESTIPFLPPKYPKPPKTVLRRFHPYHPPQNLTLFPLLADHDSVDPLAVSYPMLTQDSGLEDNKEEAGAFTPPSPQ
jgi:hypothetical protein